MPRAAIVVVAIVGAVSGCAPTSPTAPLPVVTVASRAHGPAVPPAEHVPGALPGPI